MKKNREEKQQAFSFISLTRIFQVGHQDIRQNGRTETRFIYYVNKYYAQEGRLCIFSASLSFSKMDLFVIRHVLLQTIENCQH